jgi:methylated-DNA-[protein]-cysteine S-methyltransferase
MASSGVRHYITKNTMRLLTCEIPTPIGPVWPTWGPDGLFGLAFGHRRAPQCSAREVADLPAVSAVLSRYFAGDLSALDSLPLVVQGTPFQNQVWQALRQIPAGQTWSYGRLAREIDRPTAVRAVANANRANPIPLFVPCHRVIAANGRLHGFAGGVAIKAQLLRHEGAPFLA